ncbi:hypothetical protein [Vannielia litorea]|uniref:Uncharacterized protein n=1 Tax=Vannielia litorea TaxID=1217970 RepID=A0A1N6GHL6_9RHOB|nr:hypothetical protein [Vannielia litorea]SIO06994.1 hypothetical protein SAMN05444002_2489 [Vannielia litorea]
MNAILAALAFAVFTAFVGVLAYSVPSPDLVAVILLTLALLAYDFLSSLFGKR